MKKIFRSYFSYPRNQRRGIVVLLIILFFQLLYLSIDQQLYTDQDTEDYSQEILSFINEQNQLQKDFKEQKAELLQLNYFDPNTISYSALIQMGISTRVANNILNYREKVSPFIRPTDLKKVYAIGDSLYHQLKNFVRIEKKFISTKKKGHQNELKNSGNTEQGKIIDINSADTTILKSIKGIGSYYAKRIINFRDALGGFYSKEQYNEIYGLKDRDESLNSLKAFTEIEENSWQRFNLNDLKQDELKEHPYIKDELARILENYSKQNGPFMSVEELRKCLLVTDDLYIKIAAYFSLD